MGVMGKLEMEGIGCCGREGQNRPQEKRCNLLKMPNALNAKVPGSVGNGNEKEK